MWMCLQELFHQMPTEKKDISISKYTHSVHILFLCSILFAFICSKTRACLHWAILIHAFHHPRMICFFVVTIEDFEVYLGRLTR